MGASAGGHLAAMLGTTNNVAAVEGALGEHVSESSSVHCAIDYFGPTDLRASPLDNVDGVVSALLGGSASEKPDIAEQASPLLHVDASDPPFYIVHGTKDPLVAYDESVALDAALREAEVPVYFQTVDGGGHGNFGAAQNEVGRRTQLFLEQQFYKPGLELPINTLQANPSN